MPDRPNILLLFTDQQRYDTIAALGNPYIQTPTLDGLVAEGVSFTSTYTPSPVCVAARCSLLLSQWPHQTGCIANMPMPQERTSLMELLQAEGYQTHGVGKMHFVPDGRKLWGFEARDFSEEGAMRPGDDFCDFLRANGFDHLADANGVRSEWYYIPQPSQLPERLHHSRWVGDRSLDFLRERDRERPFLLWSSFIKPHPPFESPVPWNRLYKPVEMPFPYTPRGHEDLLTFWNHVQNRYKYRDQGFDGNLVRLIRAAYYAAISYVDYNAGRILAQLREEGELDNTLVIFTSDHGELLGDYGSYGKRSMLDAAARIPLLARFPERFAAGQRCERLASLVDVLPTCLKAAGLSPAEHHVGVDLSALAAGDASRDAVVSQYQQDGVGLYGLMTDDWKYYYSAPDGREWLLRRGPGLTDERNLAGNAAYESTLADLRRRLIEWFRADGYEAPLDGESWRTFERRAVPASTDAWQLFQEGAPVDDLFPPGYAPRCRPAGGLPVRGI
jgi:arylsulfatase A-like enzyme